MYSARKAFRTSSPVLGTNKPPRFQAIHLYLLSPKRGCSPKSNHLFPRKVADALLKWRRCTIYGKYWTDGKPNKYLLSILISIHVRTSMQQKMAKPPPSGGFCFACFCLCNKKWRSPRPPAAFVLRVSAFKIIKRLFRVSPTHKTTNGSG